MTVIAHKNQNNSRQQGLAALALVLMLGATGSALAAKPATTVDIRYTGQLGGLSQSLELDWRGDEMRTRAGTLSFETRGATSFEAFCIELAQSTSTSFRTYTVGSFAGSQGSLLQGLFSSSYATVDNSLERSAFQLAIWELTHEAPKNGYSVRDNNSRQSFNLNSDSSNYYPLRDLANGYLYAATHYSGPDLYKLDRLSNSSAQDLVRFTAISAVPEPGSYAMLAAGLGVLGFVARRRRKTAAAA